jgi:hypothetical protein
MSIESAVFEGIARRAMDDGMALVNKGCLSDYEQGMLFAYFDILDWAKQPAEMHRIKFNDKELQEFDPYTLHYRETQAKAI